MATALLSSFFLDLLLGFSSTWRCAYEHFSPNLQPLLVLWTSILEGATFHRMNWCNFLWSNPCTAIEAFYHWDSFLWDFRFSMFFFHSAAWKKSETDSAVSFLHAYWYRGGNCNCLLFSTARWFSIANNLQEFFVHAVLSPDSWPRSFSHNFHIWRKDSYFVFLARYFSSPSFSICDNQVLISSDESPTHTIPIRSWVSQTLVFLICTILPRCHHAGFSSWTIKLRPT